MLILCTWSGKISGKRHLPNTIVVISLYFLIRERCVHGQRKYQFKKVYPVEHIVDSSVNFNANDFCQPQVDVITFQEVFMGGCFSDLRMRDLLTQAGFPYHTGTVGEPLQWPPKDLYIINGGIMIASRYPITREKQMVFEYIDSFSPDRVMAKGIMYARVEKTVNGQSKTYHVFNTHFIFAQEDDRREGRLEQAQEVYEFIKAQGIPRNEPVLIGGDFNMDWNQELEIGHIHEVTGILNAGIPVRVGSQETTHGTFNDWPNKKDKWLDYVLWSKDHQEPTYASIQVATEVTLNPKVEICYKAPVLTTWTYLWPNDATCKEIKELKDLSDHWPVIATYIFPSL